MRIMKPLSVFMVWGILFLCLPLAAPTQQRVRDYGNMWSAEELKKLIDSEKEILIIDTLPVSRHRQGHIPGQRISNSPMHISIWNNGIPRQWEVKARKISLNYSAGIRTGPSSSIVGM